MGGDGAFGAHSRWSAEMRLGFDALAQTRPHDAVDIWLCSLAAFAPDRGGDSRRAATHSNLGVAYILVGQRSEADDALDAAEADWIEAIEALATLEFPVVGRSSSFHFKLASGNVAAFQETRRKRYAALCQACLAITRFNRQFAKARAPRRATLEASARELAARLSDVFGPLSAEVRALGGIVSTASSAELSNASPYAEKSAEFESRLHSMSALLPEACLDLEAATVLTALIALDTRFRPLHRASTRVEHSKSRNISTLLLGRSVTNNE